MSRDGKIRAAERLFDAFGEIDDSIIKEAENVNFERKRTFADARFNRLAATAALLVLCVGIGGGLLLGRGYIGLEDNMLSADDGEVNESLSYLSFDAVLLEAVETSAAEIVAPDTIDFFDGETSIIWSYDNNDYYKVILRNISSDKMKSEVTTYKQQIDEITASTLDCKVWISYGNGEVVSPYLKSSSGNIGYAELFDYSAEVLPSEIFTRFVRNEIFD